MTWVLQGLAITKLLSQSSLGCEHLAIARRVCEGCGPYVVEHGSKELIDHIQHVLDTEDTEEQVNPILSKHVCEVCTHYLVIQEAAIKALAEHMYCSSTPWSLEKEPTASNNDRPELRSSIDTMSPINPTMGGQGLDSSLWAPDIDMAGSQEPQMAAHSGQSRALPDDGLIAELFQLYDLDLSGTINSHKELRQLTTNLMIKCGARVKVSHYKCSPSHVLEF